MTGQEFRARIGASWPAQRMLSLAEKIADGIVHGIGLVLALVAGTVLITLAVLRTAPEDVPALAVYVGAFVLLLGVSMAFNLWPQQRGQAGAGALRPGGDFPLHRRDLHARSSPKCGRRPRASD